MKILFIIRPYWTGNGRSSPNWCRISAMISGLGFRPAIARAGSTPGVLKKITNTSAVITNMTRAIHSVRRTMNVSIGALPCRSGRPPPGPPLPLHPQLGARIERVPDAVAQHVESQHDENDHESGRERDPRPRVQQVLAVAVDRSPAGIGRLHTDRQERQRRLGED